MTSQSRKELLTNTERDRLIHRQDTTDIKTRSANDARVKRKLAAWLQNFDDVLLILDTLPEDQINAILPDEVVFKLYKLTERMIQIREFSPIEGRIFDEKWRGFRGEVNDLDIWRSYHLYQHLMRLFDLFGHKNPFWDNYNILESMASDKEFQARLTPEERRGMERIARALKAYSEE